MKKIIIFLSCILLLTSCSLQKYSSTTLPSTENSATIYITSIPSSEASIESTVPMTSSAPTVPTILETTTPVDPIELLINAMSLEEKVGQLFLARCPASGALESISQYHLGGYILFGSDFDNQDPISMQNIIQNYQDASEIPLLIAVDEEGGTVCRVSSHDTFRDTRFPSPRSLYDNGGIDFVLQTETKKCILLSSLGINVNMAPVCDISTDPNAFMYSRSLGQAPETTGAFIKSTVLLMDQYHIGSVLKHFPGYGNNSDTHTGIAIDNRPLEELESSDLVPFRYGIQSNCGAILVSHTFVNAMDSEMPASLSLPVHQYLRNQMNFNGVIVTDDLVMHAITDQYGAEEAAVLAILAGNDLLCSSEFDIQYTAVLNAVKSGRIPQDTLNASVYRLLTWKQNLGLLNFS